MSVFALGIMTIAPSERSGTIGEITKKDAAGRFPDILSPTAASPSLSHYVQQHRSVLGWEWILVSALHETQINSSSAEHHGFWASRPLQALAYYYVLVVDAMYSYTKGEKKM